MSKIKVEGVEITILTQNESDFISLTDMAKSQHENIIITKWLSLKNTIEYLGEWEAMYNPSFNYTDFGTIKNTAGGNNYVLSVKEWIEKTGAIGIQAKAGRYGGTYAHKDIAFHFGMWMSPRFQLLLVKEFQRLKEEENKRLNSEWDYRRFLSKANYTLHTDAVKNHVIPSLRVCLNFVQ
ncbi:MAG: DNA-binding protein [Mucilaginibacter sp.]|nr:DNA-binding protein [Mucilaginibacter sp.]